MCARMCILHILLDRTISFRAWMDGLYVAFQFMIFDIDVTFQTLNRFLLHQV